jgi:signal transduction histidine kinase
VAHELRNPLGALKNAAYFLGMVLQAPEREVRETLQIVNAEVATCERIIGNLLDFARPREAGVSRVAVDEVLRQVLVHVPPPDHVRVSLETPGQPVVVQGDPEQLAQSFGNIIRNAYQAMPRRVGPGELSIRVERAGVDGVSVAFTDSGEGVAEQHLAAIFEPLFTTKAKGIGLGLAVTRTMVEQHGGTIEVRNEPRGGATFTVVLPGRPPGANPSGQARSAPP